MKFEIANMAIAAVAAIGLATSSASARAAEKDIVDTAVSAGQFDTLAAALGAAGLVDTLKGAGPFTVFAPTDDAFAKLPAGTVDNLLKPENKDQLIAILTYHVVPGSVMAADVVKLTEAKTVNGKMVTVKVDGSNVMINDAKVVTPDIAASNGVIHVIDAVILPPERLNNARRAALDRGGPAFSSNGEQNESLEPDNAHSRHRRRLELGAGRAVRLRPGRHDPRRRVAPRATGLHPGRHFRPLAAGSSRRRLQRGRGVRHRRTIGTLSVVVVPLPDQAAGRPH